LLQQLQTKVSVPSLVYKFSILETLHRSLQLATIGARFSGNSAGVAVTIALMSTSTTVPPPMAQARVLIVEDPR